MRKFAKNKFNCVRKECRNSAESSRTFHGNLGKIFCDDLFLNEPIISELLNPGWPRFGSVRLRFGDGTVRAVPVFGSGGSSKAGGFCVFQYSSRERDGSDSGFGSWKTVPAVPVPCSVSEKTQRAPGLKKFNLERQY